MEHVVGKDDGGDEVAPLEGNFPVESQKNTPMSLDDAPRQHMGLHSSKKSHRHKKKTSKKIAEEMAPIRNSDHADDEDDGDDKQTVHMTERTDVDALTPKDSVVGGCYGDDSGDDSRPALDGYSSPLGWSPVQPRLHGYAARANPVPICHRLQLRPGGASAAFANSGGRFSISSLLNLKDEAEDGAEDGTGDCSAACVSRRHTARTR